ncbi:MAG: 1,3-beta-glucanase [Glaciihabitans sp.]|jgi:hypothetical protein|nr:1,3-beta-glucanase [Glaciihabitans sp.]
MPRARIAKGLLPPTNRWFSGLAFGANPQPVFPLPLSFGLTATGFAFGVPPVTTSADTITAPFTPSVVVDASAATSEITAYDEASVTVRQSDAAGDPIGSEVIAEGSPLVSFTAQKSVELKLGQQFTASGKGVFTAKIGASDYGLVTSGGLNGSALALSSGQTAVWFAVPPGKSAADLASHVSALKSVKLDYSVSNTVASTTLDYASTGASLVVAMPNQAASLRKPSSCDLGSFPSVYGRLSLCAGPTLSWNSPGVTPSDALDLSSLSTQQKAQVSKDLGADVAANAPSPADSYFGGKSLYRLANLLALAHQLGQTALAAKVQQQLDAGLTKWTNPHGCSQGASRCFVYDPAAKGIVGLTASFGSDQFNDHHFHYGYFLYAASVASKYEPSLTGKLKPVINLLAADLATSGKSTSFPQRRVFDAYAGHSWASGYSPFADGNNQESSSEAINAWNGLALWASTTGNTQLETEARWMLASEAASAKWYWTNFDKKDPVYDGYKHSVVGINWGAKRDYATWFSAAPSAKLAIQLIPMSPVSGYLKGDSARIRSNVTEAAPTGFGVPLGDYLLMYSALEGGSAQAHAASVARTQPSEFIDGADSRSYLEAWIMSR